MQNVIFMIFWSVGRKLTSENIANLGEPMSRLGVKESARVFESTDLTPWVKHVTAIWWGKDEAQWLVLIFQWTGECCSVFLGQRLVSQNQKWGDCKGWIFWFQNYLHPQVIYIIPVSKGPKSEPTNLKGKSLQTALLLLLSISLGIHL